MGKDIQRRRNWPAGKWRSPFTRFFEDFLSDVESEMPEVAEMWGRGRFAPPIDISEDDSQVKVSAEMPGMTKDDVEITLEQGILTLRGEKKQEEKTEEGNYRRTERRYGRFERSIRLPEYANPEEADATFKDGVLTITLPKKETARARKIEVKEG